MSTNNLRHAIPEYEPVRAFYEAPGDSLNNPTNQIQIEARMYQIMSTPSATPNDARRFTRARRAIIATATTLAVGIGGATAATATGLDNPVGDWVTSFFTNSRIVVSDGPVQFDSDQGMAACAVGFQAFPAQWTAIEDDDEVSEIVAGNNGIPSLEPMTMDSSELPDQTPRYPELEAGYSFRLSDMDEANRILATIDLDSLPGQRPVVPEDLINDQGHFVISSSNFDPVFIAALNEKFTAALIDAGLNPENYRLTPTTWCELDSGSGGNQLDENVVEVDGSGRMGWSMPGIPEAPLTIQIPSRQ